MLTLVKIGNSQGIRIPKPIIKQAHLENCELTLEVVEEGILVKPIKSPRDGWAEELERKLENQPDYIDHDWIESPLTTDEDWEW